MCTDVLLYSLYTRHRQHERFIEHPIDEPPQDARYCRPPSSSCTRHARSDRLAEVASHALAPQADRAQGLSELESDRSRDPSARMDASEHRSARCRTHSMTPRACATVRGMSRGPSWFHLLSLHPAGDPHVNRALPRRYTATCSNKTKLCTRLPAAGRVCVYARGAASASRSCLVRPSPPAAGRTR